MEDPDFETRARDTNQVVLEALDRAEQLVELSEERRLVREQVWNRLPLFEPGTMHSAAEAEWGFRARDGYYVDVCTSGAVMIGDVRAKDADDGKINCFVNRWPEGIAWCYWSDVRKAPCGKSLAECVMDYGLGGWRDLVWGLQARFVYLDESRSHKPGRCFILAMSKISNPQEPILVKGHEEASDVFRVYRSALSPEMHKTIGMRELANLRERPIPPRWWEWGEA
jgi:hypothetical protein